MAQSECEAVFLFIAELTGSYTAGTGTVKDKIKCGQYSYIEGYLHSLDLSTEEGRTELNENIWLERLYKELDRYFELYEGNKALRALSIDIGAYRESGYDWSVPIELDASNSLMQILSVLLNDKRGMELTNVIGATLEDSWASVKGVPRKLLKTAATPQVYGSSATCQALWKNAKLKYTDKHVELYKKEMGNGIFGLLVEFKEFVINNCNMKPKLKVKIWNDIFTVDCNKFRMKSEKMKAYKIFDSNQQVYNTILHTDTVKVPDLDAFKLFSPTLLVHGVDSQIMDTVCTEVLKICDFAVPIHDAILISPATAALVRKEYAKQLVNLYNNREQVLKDFFKSVGITSEASSHWNKVKDKIVPFIGDLETEMSMPLK